MYSNLSLYNSFYYPHFYFYKKIPERKLSHSGILFIFSVDLLGKLIATGRMLRGGHGFAFAHENAIQCLPVFVDYSVSSGLGTNVAAVQSHHKFIPP
jgi:hypothetical protein